MVFYALAWRGIGLRSSICATSSESNQECFVSYLTFRSFRASASFCCSVSATSEVADTEWQKSALFFLICRQETCVLKSGSHDSVLVSTETADIFPHATELSRETQTYDIFHFPRCALLLVSYQLKTWDFVELSQRESYGDINVTAGVSMVLFLRAISCFI